MKVAIIGGGAAGFFAAIHAKMNHPTAEVILYEKSKKLLAKVKISGGGRCNVTNGCTDIKTLSKAYPRGEKKLKRAFRTFQTTNTVEWFESRGVKLMTQEDNCLFPVSQDSQSIIDCLMNVAYNLDVKIKTSSRILAIKQLENQLELDFGNKYPKVLYDKIIVATGGSPKRSGLEWLANLGHDIVDPVPSLFTFNMPTEKIRDLMGVVVEKTKVSIQSTNLKADGPLLITHWGMSGPAILKLSAFGARILSEKNYDFKVQVNWVNEVNYDRVLGEVKNIVADHSQKFLSNFRPYLLPERLWHYLVQKCDLPLNKRWGELGKKGINKLVTVLTNDVYAVKGKTTFKEEFVTCGGVSLSNIDFETMQSKVCPNVYFAGEVLDIDGITGGYNFQAAWTTGFIAGKLG